MKKFKKNIGFFFVLIFPLLISILTFFMFSAKGPFWLGQNSDPSYPYLIDGLRVMQGGVPDAVDHPGTPLHELTAAVVRTLNIAQPDSFKVVERAMANSEFYLNGIYGVIIFVFFASLIWLTLFVYLKTKSLWLSFVVQIPAVIYLLTKSYSSGDYILTVLTNCYPETLMIVFCNLFAIAICFLFFTDENKIAIPIFLGIVCAFGLTTKITFLPLVIIPLFLVKGLRNKIVYVLSLFGSAAIILIPIYSRLGKVFSFFSAIATHTGNYGTGEKKLIDVAQLIVNFKSICAQDFIFTFFMVFLAVCFVYLIVRLIVAKELKSRIDKVKFNCNRLKCLEFFFVIFVFFVGQYVMALKHPAPHYFIPAKSLVGLLLFFIFILIENKILNRVLKAVISVIVIVSLVYSIYYIYQLKKASSTALEFSEHVYSRYNNCIIFDYYRSSTKDFALRFGQRDDKVYGKILKKLYPNSYFYHYPSRLFLDYNGPVSLDVFKQANSCTLIYGSTVSSFNRLLSVEKLESRGRESLYKVNYATKDVALYFYYLSRDLYSKKDYKNALIAAAKAKLLGCPDIDEYLIEIQNELRN